MRLIELACFGAAGGSPRFWLKLLCAQVCSIVCVSSLQHRVRFKSAASCALRTPELGRGRPWPAAELRQGSSACRPRRLLDSRIRAHVEAAHATHIGIYVYFTNHSVRITLLRDILAA